MEERIKKKYGPPRYFKIIGLFFIALAFAILFIPEEIPIAKRVLEDDFMIIGLFLIATASDKIEDERTSLMRLKVAAFVLFITVFTVVLQDPIYYVISFISGENFETTVKTGKELIVQMLIGYVLFYELAKRDKLFKGKEN